MSKESIKIVQRTLTRGKREEVKQTANCDGKSVSETDVALGNTILGLEKYQSM